MKFKTQWNANEFPNRYEVNTQPSLTIPDQSMSIQEINRRFASGLPLGGQKVAEYDGGEDDFPDMTHWDLAEREEYIKAAQMELETFQRQLSKNQENYKKAQEKLKAAKKADELEYTEAEENSSDDAPPVYPKKLPSEGASGGNRDSGANQKKH